VCVCVDEIKPDCVCVFVCVRNTHCVCACVCMCETLCLEYYSSWSRQVVLLPLASQRAASQLPRLPWVFMQGFETLAPDALPLLLATAAILQAPPAAPAPGDGANGSAAIAEKKTEKVEQKEPVSAKA
jgi:hypothetical protein